MATTKNGSEDFFSVDAFCRALNNEVSHDDVVKAIKAGVIKNSPKKSLVPAEARKQQAYRIPKDQLPVARKILGL